MTHNQLQMIEAIYNNDFIKIKTMLKCGFDPTEYIEGNKTAIDFCNEQQPAIIYLFCTFGIHWIESFIYKNPVEKYLNGDKEIRQKIYKRTISYLHWVEKNLIQHQLENELNEILTQINQNQQQYKNQFILFQN